MGAIRFIGNYDVASEGKFLWEILTQLKGFGLGRMVTKNEWSRKWPSQPSFCLIRRVRPGMDRWLHSGTMWAEWTFRGRALGMFQFDKDLNRSDWRLIHRDEEHLFSTIKETMSDVILPARFPLPPLQTYMSKQYAKRSGQSWTKDREYAPFDVVLDPEMEMLRPFIRLKEKGGEEMRDIYDLDPSIFLDLYGQELPTKVESWNLGAAMFETRFKSKEKLRKMVVDMAK